MLDPNHGSNRLPPVPHCSLLTLYGVSLPEHQSDLLLSLSLVTSHGDLARIEHAAGGANPPIVNVMSL